MRSFILRQCVVEHLQVLDLSNNPLTALPIEVGNLQLLKETQKWEVGVGLLGNLVSINLHNIQLTAWPAQFETLILLQTLTLSNNSLTEVPTNVCDHPRLGAFNASHNQIAKLPLSLFYLPIKVKLSVSLIRKDFDYCVNACVLVDDGLVIQCHNSVSRSRG